MYQRTSANKRITQLIYSITDLDRPKAHKEYIFVSKEVNKMTDIFNSRCKIPIIDAEDDVMLFRYAESKKFIVVTFKRLMDDTYKQNVETEYSDEAGNLPEWRTNRNY